MGTMSKILQDTIDREFEKDITDGAVFYDRDDWWEAQDIEKMRLESQESEDN